ncbi:MAG: hypothetical protein GF398_18095 [Chitinivibrionales bacterium]|nr:hypothetical protein [Chitinivibrionales bacterium]
MVIDAFISDHFDEALAIHEVCKNEGLPNSEARLYTYIHVKDTTADKLEKKLTEDDELSVNALEVMLGKKRLVDLFPRIAGLLPHTKSRNTLALLAKNLKFIEQEARARYGMEFRISSELLKRLRFHTDSTFKAQKLSYYRNKIVPKIRAAASAK